MFIEIKKTKEYKYIVNEMNLSEIISILKYKWWIIMVFIIIGVSGTFFYCKYFLTPVYESNATIYVGRDIENDSSIVYNDIIIGERLVGDYREIVKSRRITGIAIERLGLESLTVSEFAGKLNVESKKDTRLIVISAQDYDPERAMNIVNTVAEVFREEIVKIMEIKNIQIIDDAIINKNPVKPDIKMNMVVALVLGIMLGVGIIFLIEFLDNTIKTAEDIEKHLDLPVIGTIPIFKKDK